MADTTARPKERGTAGGRSRNAGAEADGIAKQVSDALGAVLQQSRSGGISKSDQALRVKAVKNFDRASRRALRLADDADEALEEEKARQQRRHELEVEDRAKRRESDERARDHEERRKDVRVMVQAEVALAQSHRKSRRENVLLALTAVCVVATVVLLAVTALRREPLILWGSGFTFLLSLAGGYELRAVEPRDGADERESPETFSWSEDPPRD
jgi:hypothetical protein